MAHGTESTYTVTLSFGTFTVDAKLFAGSPGRSGGPPEHCYEAEPPEAEILRVRRADGSEMPVIAYCEAMTQADADADADFAAVCAAADPGSDDIAPTDDWTPKVARGFEEWLEERRREDAAYIAAHEDEYAADMAFDAAREDRAFGRR